MTKIVTSKESLAGSVLAGMASLRTCCERMERQVRESAGLSEAQCWLLACMPAEGAVATGELCKDAGLSPSRGGRVVEELVSRGLAARREDLSDRRIAKIGLTPDGQALKAQLDSMLRECEQGVVGRLNPQELATVQAGLQLLTRALDTYGARRDGP